MKKIILFLVALAVWLLITWSLRYQNIIVGAIISGLVSLWFGDIFVKEGSIASLPRKFLWLLYYIPLLIFEMVKANFDVAYRVIHPKMPINPGIVKVKTDLKSDIALTALANSITLTPGTMTIDIEDGYLYVHWINVRTTEIEEASRYIPGRFERFLKRIFE